MKKYRGLGLWIALCNVFINVIAVFLLAVTAVWMSLTDSFSILPQQKLTPIISAESLEALSESIDTTQSFFGLISGFDDAGWNLENNAIRLTVSCMVVVAAWVTIVVVLYVRTRNIVVGLLAWSLVEFIFALTVSILDGTSIVSAQDDCFANVPQFVTNNLVICRTNPWAWTVFGFDVALTVFLVGVSIVYVVALVKGVPEEQEFDDLYHAQVGKAEEVEIAEFNASAANGYDEIPNAVGY